MFPPHPASVAPVTPRIAATYAYTDEAGQLLFECVRFTPKTFRQRRPGLNGEIFELIKFRTMTDERDPDGRLLPDAHRLTAFGKWLRSTSLDELPELLNILRG
ncbi:MAG: hypothetical protein EB141_08815, partial [Verrucomicrobia bacterium]|nr:hypothetical protein [Verrucomicrobiota bacterium]